MPEENIKYVERIVNIELLNDKLNYIIAMLESTLIGEPIEEKKDDTEQKEPKKPDKSVY